MARDDEDFEQAARKLRIEVGIDDRFCPDMVFVLNELKRLGRIKDFICVPDEHMQDAASYDSDERVLRMRESLFRTLDHVCRGPNQERRRARFTIAHELGHMIFSHDGKFFRGPTSDAAARIPSQVRYREPEANRFAAAFLMPSHLTKPNMAAEDICELFDTNISSAKLRKESLAKLDRRARGIDKPIPKGVAEWLQGQREKGYKVSSLDREDARRQAKRKKPDKNDREGEPDK